mmetsp:Transcript_146050/g.468381  ORF Transcript_146050/g.468381 Transcript_146050/m.468381 type:complete len:330 (-) Transcript_146050:12-1001(-)
MVTGGHPSNHRPSPSQLAFLGLDLALSLVRRRWPRLSADEQVVGDRALGPWHWQRWPLRRVLEEDWTRDLLPRLTDPTWPEVLTLLQGPHRNDDEHASGLGKDPAQLGKVAPALGVCADAIRKALVEHSIEVAVRKSHVAGIHGQKCQPRVGLTHVLCDVRGEVDTGRSPAPLRHVRAELGVARANDQHALVSCRQRKMQGALELREADSIPLVPVAAMLALVPVDTIPIQRIVCAAVVPFVLAKLALPLGPCSDSSAGRQVQSEQQQRQQQRIATLSQRQSSHSPAGVQKSMGVPQSSGWAPAATSSRHKKHHREQLRTNGWLRAGRA